MTALDRFWSKVDRRSDDECWPWTAKTTGGYGYFHTGEGRRQVVAHRFAYELLVARIPEGLVIDHLCRNRACCNPAHMEPVTNKENLMRGEGPTAKNARKTHCKRGHEFTPENTRWSNSFRERECRTCRREWDRRRRRGHGYRDYASGEWRFAR